MLDKLIVEKAEKLAKEEDVDYNLAEKVVKESIKILLENEESELCKAIDDIIDYEKFKIKGVV
jgi:hypothetical protein